MNGEGCNLYWWGKLPHQYFGIGYTVDGFLIGNSKAIFGTSIFHINKTHKMVVLKIGNESIKITL